MNRLAASGRLLVVAGAVTALAGTFLPWLASGSTDRSSYELVDIVDRLGFAPDGALGVLARLWPIVPILLVLAAAGQSTHLRNAVGHRWLPAIGFVVSLAACYVAAGAVAVLAAPEIELFRVRVGVTVSLLGAVAMLSGAVLDVVARLRARRPTGLVR